MNIEIRVQETNEYDEYDQETPISDIATGLNRLRSIDQAEALRELYKYASPDLREAIRVVFE